MKAILILSLVCLTQFAHAAVVTLTAQASTETNGVAELTIGPYEVGEVISFPYGDISGRLLILKDGRTLQYPIANWAPLSRPLDPLVVAGPAKIRLESLDSARPVLCTIRISPEAFPPDRALLVPPGTNQVRITLECSTNLVQWFAATNGVYGPLPEAKFFRIKLEPAQ
jgi:hypothetical protein